MNHKVNQRLDAAAFDPVSRLGAKLAALNTRIARLALLLGAPLDGPGHTRRILNRDPSFFPSQSMPANSSGSEHRQARGWEELRGLIVLRYEIITQAVDGFGADPNAQVAVHVLVEEYLARDA